MPPDWIQDAIFYQIFPDRFANGDPSNDPVNVQPWGASPTIRGFQGGDLIGIVDQFDYFLELGINAILFNPIFQATSNHRYNTTDYFKIDSKLGTTVDFKALLDRAHENGVRIILDGVFNHCGRGFFAFQDVLENERDSSYLDWFHVRRFPLDVYGKGKAEKYKAWWGYAKYWIDEGIDGWRLDVPNEIDDDVFWGEFREIIKSANPEAYLVGEIWEAKPRWVGDGHFDGLMNYPLRDLLIDLIVKRSSKATEFASGLEELLNTYTGKYYFSQLLTLGSHDTKRLKTICRGNVEAVQLIYLIQFCVPGAPHIYYGDEIGLEGGKDPGCRGAFPWDRSEWDHAHWEFIRKLIDIRKRLVQLRRGNFQRIEEDDQSGVVVFSRKVEDQVALIIVNSGRSASRLSLATERLAFWNNAELYDVLNGRDVPRSGSHLEMDLKPLEGAIVISREQFESI
jgi:glycosidase